MNARKIARGAAGTALAVGAYAGALAAARPRYRRWGATEREIRGRLPGDRLARRLGVVSNHAITIHAPVEEVWKWLVQIGQDRGGFYSYSVLENAFLAGIRNADRIHPEWQELHRGDHVRLGSKKVYGDRTLLKVSRIRRNHYLVLRGWGAFVLRPIDDETTRMIIRSHGRPAGPVEKVVNYLFWDPAHFVMERGMLRGIKARAERSWAARKARALAA